MILYNLKTIEPHYRITKFDEDMNPESSYLVSDIACECPQGHKPTCRHRKMLGACLRIIDTKFFYCFDDDTYRTADGSHHSMGIAQIAPAGPSEPVAEPSSFRRRV